MDARGAARLRAGLGFGLDYTPGGARPLAAGWGNASRPRAMGDVTPQCRRPGVKKPPLRDATAGPPRACSGGMQATLLLPPPPLVPGLGPLARAALFLDFDGTLVEIAATPDAVRVPPGLPGLLARLAAGLGGALAVVSGRPLADLDHFLP